MAIRSFLATHDLIAVSANNKETAINTEQALDTTMLCALGDIINVTPRRESNENEMTGKEEPDTIYDLGATVDASFNFEKGQPQHFAFLTAYALGSIATAAAGTGYQHTITPISGDIDSNRSLPSFTAAQRYGKTVMKRRFASMFVDSVSATFARDSWCKITGAIKGTGKVTTNTVQESITALGTVTTLTLAANGVQGSTADERLQNVQQIIVDLAGTGVWTEVAYSAVSAATPAAITITAPGGAVSMTYKVLYMPTETGWMSFPARVNETPLRVAQMTVNVGGKWGGSSFTGGRAVSSEIKSIEWTLNNNLDIQFALGASGAYASRAMRQGRKQKIKLDKDFKEYILQMHIDNNDTFGIYILAEGALYDGSNKYQVEIIFPKVGVIASPVSPDGNRLSESGDLQVLEDDTYGSVVVKVKNLTATYMV